MRMSRLLRELQSQTTPEANEALLDLLRSGDPPLRGVGELWREILSSIPDADIVEMPRSGAKGLCCGAGGGNMWMEEAGTRVNHLRAAEAANTGASIVATACPFCVQMFEDGIPAVQPDEATRSIRVMDLAELLEASVAPSTPEPVAVAAEPDADPEE